MTCQTFFIMVIAKQAASLSHKITAGSKGNHLNSRNAESEGTLWA